MKVIVNELAECKRGLEVEVPTELVSEEIERTLREYSARAKIPGFRQGKIPMDVVRRRFGKEVRDEVVGRMVQEYAIKALEEERLDPVQPPVLDEVHFESGQPLKFKATFEVRPPLDISDYKKIPVTIARQTVTDEMVETSLKGLAERAAKLEAVSGRPVQKGDFVVGTLSCRFLKGKGKNLNDEKLLLEAGSEENHPDFNAAVLGAEPGDSKSFETSYPEDHSAPTLRGRTIAYTIMIREIKKKVVPPLDDELAKELGNFQNLGELRDKVRSEIDRRAQEAERAEAKNKIIGELVRRHPIEVPESLIEIQIDNRLEMMAREMVAQGIDPTKAEVDWPEQRKKLRPGATDGVRAMLILEAIAAQERIEATEEDVNAWLRDEARRHKTSVAAVKEKFVETARLTSVRRQIVREKSLDFLVSDAIITTEVK